MARRTSSRCTSRGLVPMVIPPRLFTPRTWLPATPTVADSTGTPTIASASSTARRIELTARSRFTIWPLRQPFDSAAPSAANFTPPCRRHPARQSARRFSCCRCRAPLYAGLSWSNQKLLKSGCTDQSRSPRRMRCRLLGRAALRHESLVGIHHCLAAKAQIHRLDASRLRAPLPDIFNQRLILGAKIAVAKMHENRSVAPNCPLVPRSISEASRGTAAVLQIRKSWRARSCTSETSTSLTRSMAPGCAESICCDKSREKLHACLAIVKRHIRVDSGDHRKMKIAFERPVQNHSVRVHQAPCRCPRAEYATGVRSMISTSI